MFRIQVGLLLLLALLVSPVWGQDNPAGRSANEQNGPVDSNEEERNQPLAVIGKGFGVDPVFLQFGGHVFVADAPSPSVPDPMDPTMKKSPEVNPFPKGQLGGDVQLAGLDFVGYFAEGKMRTGVNLGLGTTTLDDFGVIIGTLGIFVQVRDYFRINVGLARARSANPELNASNRDRDAWFAGVSFPTNLGDMLTGK